MVVGKYSSRVNEDMDRVPICKLPNISHEILLEEERKVRKFLGRGQRIETSRSEDHSIGRRVCKAL
jgi:hypothetical protein